jgi:hypothetical protein
VRQVMSQLGTATVVYHGDDQAGAIYVKIARLDGTAALYSPAPQSFAMAEEPSETDGERRFTAYFPAGTPERQVDDHMQRQREFDGDLWLIEIEDRQGRHFLDGWLSAG